MAWLSLHYTTILNRQRWLVPVAFHEIWYTHTQGGTEPLHNQLYSTLPSHTLNSAMKLQNLCGQHLETQLKYPTTLPLWPVGLSMACNPPRCPTLGLPSILWLPFYAFFLLGFLDKWVVIVTCSGHLSTYTGLRYTGRTWLRWELIRFFP